MSVHRMARGRGLFVSALVGVAFMAGAVTASAYDPHHPTMLTGTDWTTFGSREKQLYLSGFLAGAAAEQVRANADAAGHGGDSASMASGAIVRLRAAKQLHFPYAPSVYSAQIDDFYWWTNHADVPIVDVMIATNRQMLNP